MKLTNMKEDFVFVSCESALRSKMEVLTLYCRKRSHGVTTKKTLTLVGVNGSLDEHFIVVIKT